MRIIHLAHYSSPYPGSFVPMLLAAREAVLRRGWSFQLVLNDEARRVDWPSALARDGVSISYLPTDGRGRLADEIASTVAAERGPTILHTHFARFDLAALQAARRSRSARVVWHIHNHPATGSLPRLAKSVLRYGVLGRKAGAVLCVAPDIAAAVRQRGAPRDRVRFFPNAIDTSLFPPVSEEERGAARSAAGIGPNSAILVHLGWDWERKGGDILLRAVRILLDAGRDLTVVTVRGGEPAETLGAHLGLGRALVVQPPVQPVQGLYALADVFVSCSRSEGMPFAISEALSRGVPVVASDIPGQRIQCEGLGACRLTRLDARDVARGIAELLDRDPAQARTDADAARRHVIDELDLRPWSDRLLGVYAAVSS